MSKTSIGLVNYAVAQLGLPYWWGGFGQTASKSLLAQLKAQYPSVYNQSMYSNASEQFGKRVHDCVGLIKGYRWSETPTSNPVYNASQDVAVSGLYNQCSKRGTISKMPNIPGICVFMSDMSHVGVYIGDGQVVEARGHLYGVVQTSLSSRGWSLYGMPDWIKYDSSVDDTVYTDYYSTLSLKQKAIIDVWPVLKKGMNSPYVAGLQMLLCFKNEETISIDSKFGAKTEVALKKYQGTKNLMQDGIAGPQTLASFFV